MESTSCGRESEVQDQVYTCTQNAVGERVRSLGLIKNDDAGHVFDQSKQYHDRQKCV